MCKEIKLCKRLMTTAPDAQMTSSVDLHLVARCVSTKKPLQKGQR